MRVNTHVLRSCFAAAVIATSTVSAPAVAQNSGRGQTRLDSGEVQKIVGAVADLIEREYVHASMAQRIAGHLLERLGEGLYGTRITPGVLASRLNSDLLGISRDKHLRVEVRNRALGSSRQPTYSREEHVRRSNAGVQRVEVLTGNVGYLNLTAFWRSDEGGEVLRNAMRLLSRADALVIDMRENLGGSPDTVILLASHLLEPDLPLFEIVPRTGTPTEFRTTETELRNDKRPVYILVSRRTFSAGEGFAFLMQERRRAIIVGETTAGAANPGRSHRVNDSFAVTIPNGLIRGAVTGSSWEGAGVTPDVAAKASDALRVAYDQARRGR